MTRLLNFEIHPFWILAAVGLLGLLAVVARGDQAQPADPAVGQAVDLDAAPQLANRPWVLIFTPAAGARDPLTAELLALVAEQTPLGARLRATTRLHILPAGHKKTPDYSKFHGDHLPALIVANPQVQSGRDILACIRRDGLKIATADAATLEGELGLDRAGPRVSAETPGLPVGRDPAEYVDEVGRPALFPRFWNDPPYVCRPYLWGRGVNLDWDGSSPGGGFGCNGGCDCDRRRPPPETPPPPPRVPWGFGFGQGQGLHPDTTLRRQMLRDKIDDLRRRIAQKTGETAGDFIGGLGTGLGNALGGQLLALAAIVGGGLAVGLLGVRVASNLAGQPPEDDD